MYREFRHQFILRTTTRRCAMYRTGDRRKSEYLAVKSRMMIKGMIMTRTRMEPRLCYELGSPAEDYDPRRKTLKHRVEKHLVLNTRVRKEA
jgi:hypothetical protein